MPPFFGPLDALLSTCNMPRGIPVATMSLGSHGAINAALFAVAEAQALRGMSLTTQATVLREALRARRARAGLHVS